jgi:hypothetical protein
MKNGHSDEPESRENACFVELAAKEKPWQIQIDVYLVDDKTDPPKFTIECQLPSYEVKSDDPRQPPKKYIVFENKHRPGFDILFHLHDETENGYKFPRRADEAVWSRAGEDCPDEAWSKHKDYDSCRVFDPIRVVEPDLMTLVVHNENDKKPDGNKIGRFSYTLTVEAVIDGQKRVLHLDPGGDDQNGARTFFAIR